MGDELLTFDEVAARAHKDVKWIRIMADRSINPLPTVRLPSLAGGDGRVRRVWWGQFRDWTIHNYADRKAPCR